MNLKLKRVVRTPHSEEIAIFDNDTRDENEDAVSIGKLEVHYLSDQIVGTLLIWSEFAQGYNATHGPGSNETLDDVIDAILTEVAEALGVAAEYGIEVYYPSVTNHSFISNYADDDSEVQDEGQETEDEEQIGPDNSEVEEPARDDEYYRKLTGR